RVEVDSNAHKELVRPLFQESEIIEDRFEGSASIPRVPVSIVLLRHSVHGDLEVAYSPGEQLVGDVGREQITVRGHRHRVVERIPLDHIEKVRAEVFDRGESVQRFASKPAHAEIPNAVGYPPGHELLDALTHFREHRAAFEILIAVFAAQVAILGGEKNQLESVLPEVLLTECGAKLADFIGVKGDEVTLVLKITSQLVQFSADAAAREQRFNRAFLVGLKHTDGAGAAVPENKVAVFRSSPRVELRRDPFAFLVRGSDLNKRVNHRVPLCVVGRYFFDIYRHCSSQPTLIRSINNQQCPHRRGPALESNIYH